ncbi:immunoglobulin lambda-1 light chain-like [Solea solea]|uniref:immunoglobulin lambda-1 light chain-like n=1 Tax=Solea solea TaxID=90069 RepID=UPI00272C93FE|nr:immunoglobulin lambda-1 light chain-like [Solea solea]
MIPSITTLTIFVFWAAGVSQCVLITQWPRNIARHPGISAEMHCYQNDTDYQYLYWYQQLRGNQIQLLVYIVAGYPTFAEGFKSGYKALRVEQKQWSLKINSTQVKDEAVYLCAASLHSAATDILEAYFGAGTKLTVLEYGVKEPKVKVLGPSSHECHNLKNDERKKTLLCLASDFYPDHISVSWEVDGVTVTTGVATDSFAARDDKYYKISSRLRVDAEDWYNSEQKKYGCIVTFFNGKNYTIHTGNILGEKAPTDFHIREKYLRATQTAKLSYAVFIIKSSIYGAFVAFLVWKLKGSSGK